MIKCYHTLFNPTQLNGDCEVKSERSGGGVDVVCDLYLPTST